MKFFHAVIPVFIFCAGCENPGKDDNKSPFSDICTQDLKTVVFDSVYISNLKFSDTIPFQVLRQIEARPADDAVADDLGRLINSVVQIDSIKQAGGYPAYLESLDIAMTADARAFPLGYLNLNKTTLYVWGIENRSYDACPFFSGTAVLASYVDVSGSHIYFPLCRIYSAGDPPSFMETKTSSKISGNSIEVFSSTMHDDDPEETGRSLETHTFVISFENEPKITLTKTLEHDDRYLQ